MDINSIIKNLIRIGECSSSEPEFGTIRATFADRENMVSGDLPVVFTGGWSENNGMPEPGDTVVCLFLGNGMSDGICIGVIYDDEDPPGTKDQRGMWFEDGSYVYYDRALKQLMINSLGAVNVTAASVVITSPTVTINGNLTVTGTVTSQGVILNGI